MKYAARGAGIALLLLLTGCGEEFDKNKGVRFQMPSQTFLVRTNDPRWGSPPPNGIPMHQCGATSQNPDCCIPPKPDPPVDCTRHPVTCDNGRCLVKFIYSQDQPLDLNMAVTNAKTMAAVDVALGDVLSDMILNKITLDITNQMNLQLPPMDLSVGPATAQSPIDPGVTKLGSTSSLSPGYRGKVTLRLGDTAKQAFSSFAKNYKTPFRLLMSTTMTLTPGTLPAMGQLKVVATAELEARY
jgi:hypothetical protein